MANKIFDTPAGTARSEDHLHPLYAVDAEAEVRRMKYNSSWHRGKGEYFRSYENNRVKILYNILHKIMDLTFTYC